MGVTVFVSCGDNGFDAAKTQYSTKASTAWGQSIVDATGSYIGHVKSDVAYNLATGVDVLEMGFISDDGLAIRMMLFKVQLGEKITMKTLLADDKDEVGKSQTIMKQMLAMEKNGKTVLGGTNADFFNMSTGIPYGVCYRNGVCIKSTFSRSDCNVFAIGKDNTAYCWTVEEYNNSKDKVSEAVCGRSTLLLSGGVPLDQSTSTMTAADLEPRTAVGVSADGKEVYLMVVDGRQFFYSNGIDLYNLVKLMQACGSWNAINLDGGGSSTFVVRRPDSDSPFTLINRPTDAGGMRAVATGLAIVQTK